MSYKKYFYLSIIAILMLSSCSIPKGYITTSQNVPLLSEANDLHAVATVGSNHFEAQVAYSPIKHIGVIGNLYALKGGSTADIGIGYNFKDKNDNIYEFYALYNGTSYSKNRTYGTLYTFNEHDYKIDMSMKYSGFGIQANIGKTFKKSTFALGIVFKNVNYSNFRYHFIDQSYPKSLTPVIGIDTNYVLNSKNQSIITFSPTFKYGNVIKYFCQFNVSLMLNDPPSINKRPFYNILVFTNGILIDFGQLRKKREKK